MTDLAGVRALDRRRPGWRRSATSCCRRAAWEAYYQPLAARVDALRPRHGADPVLARGREEIAVWRAHGADYGYAFFVAG